MISNFISHFSKVPLHLINKFILCVCCVFQPAQALSEVRDALISIFMFQNPTNPSKALLNNTFCPDTATYPGLSFICTFIRVLIPNFHYCPACSSLPQPQTRPKIEVCFWFMFFQCLHLYLTLNRYTVIFVGAHMYRTPMILSSPFARHFSKHHSI